MEPLINPAVVATEEGEKRLKMLKERDNEYSDNKYKRLNNNNLTQKVRTIKENFDNAFEKLKAKISEKISGKTDKEIDDILQSASEELRPFEYSPLGGVQMNLGNVINVPYSHNMIMAAILYEYVTSQPDEGHKQIAADNAKKFINELNEKDDLTRTKILRKFCVDGLLNKKLELAA